MYRGVLLRRWSTKWGVTRGWVASSIAFGALHFVWFLSATLSGLVFGWLYLRSRTLVVPILCHALYNAASLTLEAFGVPSFPAIGPETYPRWLVAGAVALLLAVGIILSLFWSDRVVLGGKAWIRRT
jgi:hypothetical protein